MEASAKTRSVESADEPALGAERIATALRELGVKRVFLFPGGTIAPLLNALIAEGIEYVCARHEQGAGYAAIGAAKVTGQPQVLMVTSGPGATNAVTPVADAYFDSVPLLVFTGQVSTGDINRDKAVRQTGFQEIDTVGVFTPITKAAHLLEHDDDIYQVTRSCFEQARQGRPGPVLIDLPMDVQRSVARVCSSSDSAHGNVPVAPNPAEPALETVEQVLDGLQQAQRPLVLVGNGVQLAGATESLRDFIDAFQVPAISSLPAVGTMPSDHPLSVSFLGHCGEYAANLAAHACDYLLVLGARLDVRQTGSEVADFVESKTIARVDIDRRELDAGRVRADLNIHADLGVFLRQLAAAASSRSALAVDRWLTDIRAWQKRYDSEQFYRGESLTCMDVIRAVDGATSGRDVVVTSGVGIHQMQVPRYFGFDGGRRQWLTSSGHGTMGYDLPACMGALIAEDGRRLGIVFVGDGSLQMNIQELATISNLGLPMKIFVLDNAKHGIVAQFQDFNWKTAPSTGHKDNPRFDDIAKAYGLRGFRADDQAALAAILPEVLADNRPALVHCAVDRSEEVLPMLMGGQRLDQMYPFSEQDQ